MTIWLMGLLLMAAVGALGFRQGAIRTGCSLLGIVLAALLAAPLGKLLKPGLAAVGLKNPALQWLLGPLIVFVLISIAFKIAALTVHQKVDVFYKYKAGDLRLALWERLNHRLGLCLGLFNGAAYFILISWIVYVFSYWTVQIGTADADPKPLQILNRMGRDLQDTGFAKVAAAVDGMKQSYYDTADVVGLIYNNSLLEARLSRYPAFLGLAERQEFQDIAADRQFTEMRQRREPVKNLWDYPKTQAIVKNPDLLRQIWTTLVPDLKDLRAFLETGKSPKYDAEKILGRWNFDLNSAMAALRRAKPNIPSSEMQKQKRWMAPAFAKTSFVAAPDHQAILKNAPRVKSITPGAPIETQTLQGQWKGLDGKYQLSFSGGGQEEATAAVEGDRLTVNGLGMSFVFIRED